MMTVAPQGPSTTHDQGARLLGRLQVFLDVVYALLFVEMLQSLPAAEDLSWVGSPFGLLSVLLADPEEVLRIAIGLGLVLIYWGLNNRLLGPLARIDAWHSWMSMLQMVFVALFLYFAIQDPRLAGGPSSPALQSLSLGIAGILGLVGWRHARRFGLIAPEIGEEERERIGTGALVDPLTALLNTPVAWLGPLAWTAGWFLIPIVVSHALRIGRATAARRRQRG
jgi:hypothetical protein